MLDSELIVMEELSDDDWEDMDVIHDILSLFKVWSLQRPGFSSPKNRPNGFFADVLPVMVELLSHSDEAMHNYSDESGYSNHIISSIHIAWLVHNKYYNLEDNPPAWYAAESDMELKYFCDEWSEHQDWIESARSQCTTMWNTKYCHLPGLCDVSPSQSTTIGAIPMPPPPEPAIPQWRRKQA